MLTPRQVAIARWEIRGERSFKPGLVLAPLNRDLLCVAFPTSHMPELPRHGLRNPQQETDSELQADRVLPASVPFEDAEFLGNDLNSFH
jgi:hypothetical protein